MKRSYRQKADFIIQEMNRETNTMGSKSGSIDIINLVIKIKTQIEDIREQIQILNNHKNFSKWFEEMEDLCN